MKRLTKDQQALLDRAYSIFREVLAHSHCSHEVSLALDPSLEDRGANAEVRGGKGESLLLVLNPSLLVPSLDNCKQLIWQTAIHEAAHLADWDSLNTTGRSKHDAHFGLEWARIHRAVVKE